ncbi:Erf-like ssDNA annealing protein [Pseudoalteromonas phage BS5]|uniref:Erf-like ssDNA annealing protein n=1 Tax=Pseudoalteromonas phage BS5 TaxID=1874539 RepID=UPI0008199942|nr:Erf-like ssDNA annealing protein [Pseudoalteromonas phage BS5]ANY29600.1 essential recombination function protein [Pseudoalteromonas phage BS5]
MKEFIKKVAEIQRNLKAPKNQFNAFGKYKYRSCEDIMEGLKPILGELVVTVSDDIKMVGDRIYIVATAKITDGENSVSNNAMARESLTKKGMDDSQITGTASSYARKYALNGLFLIDDTKDADSMDGNQNQPAKSAKPSQQQNVNWYNTFENDKQYMLVDIQSGAKTADMIISELKANGYAVSNQVADQIKNLK